MQCNTLDNSYVKHTGLSIFYWLHSVFDTIKTPTKHHYELHLIMPWIPLEYFPHHIHTSEISYITANLTSSRDLKISLFRASDFGDAVDAKRFDIFISQMTLQ